MKRKTINRQILGWMLVVTLLPIVLLSFYYLQAYDQNFKKQTFAKLTQIADKKTEKIGTYISTRIADAHVVAHIPITAEILKELGTQFKHRNDNRESYHQLQSRYSKKAQHFLELGYYDIFFVSLDRNVLFTLKHEDDQHTNLNTGVYAETELAKSVEQAFLLIEPALSNFSYYPPSNELAAFISVPVLENNLIIGVIAFQLDIEKLQNVVNNSTGLGVTGSTHIATIYNQSSLFHTHLDNAIKPSAFESVRQVDFGLAMKQALLGNTGYTMTLDSHSHEMLAVYQYLPALHAGLVVGVYSQEALKELNMFWTLSVFVLTVIISLLVFVAYKLSQSITKPLNRLTKVSTSIAKGDTEQALVPEGTVETVELATSFNVMLKQLGSEKAKLEQRVQQRTFELSQKEQHLALTLNSIGDAVISTDVKGCVTRMNPVAERLTGWKIEAARGKSIKDVFNSVDVVTKEGIRSPVEEVIATGRIVNLNNHTILISKQGKQYYITDTAAPICNADNDILGMVLVFNDVTENYHLRESEKVMNEHVFESEKRLRLYQQQSPIAMIEWDMDCKVVEWNEAAERVFGFSKPEVLGRSFLDFLIIENEKLEVTALWDVIVSESANRVNVNENLTKGGAIITCEWHNTILKNDHGEVVGVASQVLDITERQRIDAVLHTLAETRGEGDEDIFQLIVRQLALSQGVQYALISQINTKNPEISDTLAVWAKGGFTENFSYPLKGTPCEQVTKEGACLYADNVQTLFPEDKLLVDLGVVCYFGVPLRTVSGEVLGIIAILDDKVAQSKFSTSKLLESLAVRTTTEIERKRAEEKLQFAARIFSETHEGIMITDTNAVIIDVNPGFSRITGFSREDAIGRPASFLSSGKQSKTFYKKMWAALAADKHWQGEVWNRSKSGEVYAELLTISSLEDDDDNVINYVGLFSDITLAKKQQKSLQHMAHYDVLTGLPNRTLFADRFSQAIAHSKRNKSLLAVCFIDLDEFKPVNDTYGHDAGDKILVEVSQRIKNMIREQDTASRLGGDEFALLLGDVFSIEQCEQAMGRIHKAIAQPYIIDGQVLTIAASSGITVYPHDKADPDTLIRHADSAMYQAKLLGRNRYHLFDAAYDEKVTKQNEQLNKVEQAFDQNQFCLYYQPKVNMLTGKVYGAEALIRWNHPDKGLIPPIDFLPCLEGTPLEIKVGNWVINEALKQLDKWRCEGVFLKVSVNISALHLQWQGFFKQVSLALEKYPEILPEQLQLEILESSVLSDVAMISDVIKSCRDSLGVSVALDDFGTGYSSLTHLRRIPADTIKIDQAFVRDMLVDESDCAIVQGITVLAKTFNRDVIAEGVETKEHGIRLMQLGCLDAQGYGIARPMPAENIVSWLQEYVPYIEWKEFAATLESED